MNLSPLLDFFGNIVPITGDSLIDSFLFFVIGAIAFSVAWGVAGSFDCDSNTRSDIHWIVRVVVFLALWALAVGVFWLIKLIASIPWWVWIIIGVVGIHIIVGIVLLNKLKKRKRLKQPQKEEEDE